MENEFMKLQLDSLEDFEYIKSCVLEASRGTIKETSGVGNDPETFEAVSKCVEKWINKLFKYVSYNTQINGIDYNEAVESQEETLPFDERLNDAVQEKELEYYEMLVRITNRRRVIPEQAKLLLADAMRRQSSIVDRVDACSMDSDDNDDDQNMFEIPEKEKTMEMYRKGLSLLSDLKKSVSANFSKLERAQTVVDDLFLLHQNH
ncbi:13486_t:CDS:2 [Ambispora leptoticha]|uniref:13486_t:CDS:1 n=1 Tax=Ambispora leptoticha TaxID=144679 RepID=A0A9N8WHC4_9GLOM|nr:13486_t:CDS:2 [Ambispora leptoticha]